MNKNSGSLRPLVTSVLLVFLMGALSACAIGPFEITYRNGGTSQNAAMTVTAVFATNTQIAAFRTATALAPTPQASPIPQSTLAPATIAPPVATNDLLLVYSPESFSLINTVGRTLDLTGISFHSDTGELMSTQWDNGFLSSSLLTFPSGDCLMAWGLDTELQPKPADCGTRHAWIAVNSSQLFWQTSNVFSVRNYGQQIASCVAANGACNVNLP